MKNTKYLTALVTLVVAFGMLAFAKSDHGKASKTGYLTLKQEATIGGVVLASGEYKVRHYNSESGHYVQFARWKGPTPTWGTSPHDYDVVARIPCEVEPRTATVTETRLLTSNGDPRVWLEIRGEQVVYIFHLGSDASTLQNQIEYCAEQ